MRTIIDLRGDQVSALEALAKRESVSRAELVRRAVDDLLAREARAGARQAYGLWRDRGIDGLEYVTALRREWDR
jgi:hypothetical protein